MLLLHRDMTLSKEIFVNDSFLTYYVINILNDHLVSVSLFIERSLVQYIYSTNLYYILSYLVLKYQL